MDIIFLDVDGVLNSETYYQTVDRSEKDWARFDPKVIELIKKLVGEFSAKIVITSTWRFGAVELLKNELRKSGLIKYLHNDWKTPQLYPPHRGKEIQSWLTEHPEIVEYVILDDDNSILEEQNSRFVKTELKSGLLEKHYSIAREILSREIN